MPSFNGLEITLDFDAVYRSAERVQDLLLQIDLNSYNFHTPT